MKKYEALELEIISVDTEVVLSGSFTSVLDTPMADVDSDWNPLEDLLNNG